MLRRGQDACICFISSKRQGLERLAPHDKTLCPTARQELIQTRRATALRFAWPATVYVAWPHGWCGAYRARVSRQIFAISSRTFCAELVLSGWELAAKLYVHMVRCHSTALFSSASGCAWVSCFTKGLCEIRLAEDLGTPSWCRPMQGRIPDADASALSAAVWAAEAAEAAATVARLWPAWQIKATTGAVAKELPGLGFIGEGRLQAL